VIGFFRLIGQRQYLDHRIVGSSREDSGFDSVDEVSLPHVDGGQELQVETGSASEVLRQRMVEIDADLHAAGFRRDFQRVAQTEGGEGQLSAERVVRFVDVAALEGCDEVPLLGRWHQAHVAVGCDALAVENHLHGRVFLVYEHGMVGAVVEKYAEALSVEVILFVHPHRKLSAENGGAGGQNQEKTDCDSGKHDVRTAPFAQLNTGCGPSGRCPFGATLG